MEKYVATVDPDDPVDWAKKMLLYRKLSCVSVVESMGKCFDVSSVSDLFHLHVPRKNQKIRKSMGGLLHKVIEASQDMPINDAAELMVKRTIHHLVVTEQ